MAGNYNFDIHIGDNWPYGPVQYATVNVKQGPKDGPYTAVNLDGVTIGQEFTTKAGDGQILCAATIVILNQVTETGKFTWWWPSTQTELLEERNYFYRFTLDFGGGRILTPVHGIVGATYG